MIAVVLNVLVRFLVRDDAGQAARAAELIQAARFGSPRPCCSRPSGSSAASSTFPAKGGRRSESLAGLETIFLEDAGAVAKALNWFEQGLDYADTLLRFAVAGNAKQFATFNRKFARQARGVTKVETLVLFDPIFNWLKTATTYQIGFPSASM